MPKRMSRPPTVRCAGTAKPPGPVRTCGTSVDLLHSARAGGRSSARGRVTLWLSMLRGDDGVGLNGQGGLDGARGDAEAVDPEDRACRIQHAGMQQRTNA